MFAIHLSTFWTCITAKKKLCFLPPRKMHVFRVKRNVLGLHRKAGEIVAHQISQLLLLEPSTQVTDGPRIIKGDIKDNLLQAHVVTCSLPPSMDEKASFFLTLEIKPTACLFITQQA